VSAAECSSVVASANSGLSFGAVLEEFEVSDALMTVLAGRFSNGNPTPA
jgi:hypothetical protein